jgi:neutral trehalase
MSEDFKNKAKDLFNRAIKATDELKDKALDGFDKSEVKSEIGKKLQDAKEYMDEKGITEKAEIGIKKAQELAELASDNFDKVSGKRILELVEGRLFLQTQYNDILATKLEEALARIAELEKKINGDK